MNHMKQTTAGVLAALCCYCCWGFQPLYWHFCGHFDALFLLANRTAIGTILCILFLGITGRLKDFQTIFRTREYMQREVPASLFLFLDWMIYMLAVLKGNVMEVSFAYYVTPLVMFILGAVIFKEPITKMHLAILLLVVAGIAMNAAGINHFPWVIISLAVCFPIYSCIKKGVPMEGVTTATVELTLVLPFAIGYVLWYGTRFGFGIYGDGNWLLLLGGGLVSGMPMMLFSVALERIPVTLIAILQYSSPTFGLLSSLILGETMNPRKWLSFSLIWLGCILYVLLSRRIQNDKNFLTDSQ